MGECLLWPQGPTKHRRPLGREPFDAKPAMIASGGNMAAADPSWYRRCSPPSAIQERSSNESQWSRTSSNAHSSGAIGLSHICFEKVTQ